MPRLLQLCLLVAGLNLWTGSGLAQDGANQVLPRQEAAATSGSTRAGSTPAGTTQAEATQAGKAQPESGQAKSTDDYVDRIHLKSGAVIQGRILEEKKAAGRMVLVVRLKSGALISLDKAKLVEKVRSYDALDAQYERQLATVKKDDPAAWRQIFDWCEEQTNGRSRFKSERQFLLEKIISLDPGDKDARRKLGYVEKEGQWVLEQVWFEARGYKLKDGRTWQSDLKSEFLAARVDGNDALKQRRSEVETWLRKYEKVPMIPEEGVAAIMSIADATTSSMLLKKLMDADEAKKILPQRRVFMEVFGKVPTGDSILALAYLSVQDGDSNIRERALTLLTQPGFDREAAAARIAGHLSTGTQESRERAAFVIGELGAMGQFISLVKALETKQKVVINPDAGRTNVAAGSGGVGLQTPSKPIIREMLVQSNESLMALKKISKVDFGYNKEAWASWYIQNYTLYDARVRTDE